MLIGIIFAIGVVPMLIISILFMNGRCGFLLSGYNTMSDAKKAMFDEKRLLSFYGKLLLLCSVIMAFLLGGTALDSEWLIFPSIILFVVVLFGGVIYGNTGGRFLKEGADLSTLPANDRGEMSKGLKIFLIVTIAVVTVGVTASIVTGEIEPSINLQDNNFRISGMYGTTVDFSNVTEIMLLEQNMSEIGTGMRINGYSSGGNALRGHFTAGLLFVQRNSSPTIKIRRETGTDIFISFRDSEHTRNAYQELTAQIK